MSVYPAKPGMSRFYNQRAWRRLSLERLAAEPWCRTCRALGQLTPAVASDHILPVQTHPDLALDPENVQSLCASHHSGAKRQEERRGYHSLVDARGFPTDARHPANRITTRGVNAMRQAGGRS